MEVQYCFECDEERPVRLEVRDETYKVRGESVAVQAHVSVCMVCGHAVFDETHDEQTLRAAYAAYRDRHGLLQPADITALRTRYRLSQRATARLLDWGPVTVLRYEHGALQDAAHEEQLRRLEDPRYVLSLIAKHPERLAAADREAVRQAALALAEAQQPAHVVKEIETDAALAAGRRPDLHGARDLSLVRLGIVVNFFASRTVRLYKTKLAKLLWLADFAHYREHGVSITGLAYARLPYGPVPDQYALVLGVLEKMEAIRLQAQGDDRGDLVIPQGGTDLDGLTASERATLLRILTCFGGMTGRELSRRSHQESVWRTRTDGELLPYQEARAVRLLDGI